MEMKNLPKGARKTSHHIYASGQEIAVFVLDRRWYYRDALTGDYPVCPIRHIPHPHPSEGTGMSQEFETLGLYYRYDMPDTGWDGDC